MICSSFVINACRRIMPGAATVGFTLAVRPMRGFAQSGGACADSTSTSAKYYRDYYRIAVSSTESHMVAFRSRTGLPSLAQTQVRFVGDTAVCRTASVALDAQRWDKFPQTPVIVLELSTALMSGNSGRLERLILFRDRLDLLYRCRCRHLWLCSDNARPPNNSGSRGERRL